MLKYIAEIDPVPWLCAGDFNKIADLSKKFRGARRMSGQMKNFKETLTHCALLDLGAWGHTTLGTAVKKVRLLHRRDLIE